MHTHILYRHSWTPYNTCHNSAWESDSSEEVKPACELSLVTKERLPLSLSTPPTSSNQTGQGQAEMHLRHGRVFKWLHLWRCSPHHQLPTLLLGRNWSLTLLFSKATAPERFSHLAKLVPEMLRPLSSAEYDPEYLMRSLPSLLLWSGKKAVSMSVAFAAWLVVMDILDSWVSCWVVDYWE